MSEIREKIEEIIHLEYIQIQETCRYTLPRKVTDKILSLLPSIDMIEHVGKCRECGGKGKYDWYVDVICADCEGTGETTRPATWEDICIILDIAKMRLKEENGMKLPFGGILRIKEVEG